MFPEGTVKLTPLYDSVCTLAYPDLTQKLSMKIGKHFEIRKVDESDVEFLANQLGLKAKSLISTYHELVKKVEHSFEIVKNDVALQEHLDIVETILLNLQNRI